MNSYILVLVTSYFLGDMAPASFSITEFSSKESCEAALSEAKGFWKTVDKESKCISVKEATKKNQMSEQLYELKKKLRDLE